MAASPETSPSSTAPRTDVVVVGAGISGIACARALTESAVPVRVLERARHVGGRLASPDLPRGGTGFPGPRPVDLGAAYFTVSGSDEPAADAFAALAQDWSRRGLALPWTDTLSARDADGTWESKPGPLRWAAPGRSSG